MAGPLSGMLDNYLQGKQFKQQKEMMQQQKQSRALLGQMLQGGDPGNLAQIDPQMYVQGQSALAQMQKRQADQQQQAQQRQLDAVENQRKQQIARIQSTALTARKLKSLDEDDWLPFLQNQFDKFQQAGIGIRDTGMALDMAKQGDFVGLNNLLDKTIELDNQVAARLANTRQGSRSFAPVYETDKDGNVTGFIPTVMPDGQVIRSELPIEGRVIKDTLKEKTAADIEKFERKEEIKSDKIAQNAVSKLVASGNAKRAQQYIENGENALSTIRALERLGELNKRVESGGYQVIKMMATDFIGRTSADEGEFRSNSRAFVLPLIKALGANPTEGERAFIQSIVPRIEHGGQEINARVIQRFLKEARRQVKRGQLARENLDAILKSGKTQVLSSVQSQQETQSFAEQPEPPIEMVDMTPQTETFDFTTVSDEELQRMLDEAE